MSNKYESHRPRFGVTPLALAGYFLCLMCAGHAAAQQTPDAPGAKPQTAVTAQTPQQAQQSPDAPGAKPQPTPAAKPPQAQQRPDFTGSWRFNRDHSDSPSAKLREYVQETDRGWGYGPGIGVPRPGYGGIGMGGPMIVGGMGRPMGIPPSRGPNYENLSRMRTLIEAPDQLTVKHQDQEIDMTDGEDRVRALVTADRKLEKPKKNSLRTEVRARWSQNSLVSEEKGPDGEKIAKTYEISDDKKQMLEIVTINNKRLISPMTIRYRYDKER